MRFTERLTMVFLALAGVLGAVGPVCAARPTVRDKARLFAPAVEKQVAAEFRAIDKDFRVQPLVETYKSVSLNPFTVRKVKALGPEAHQEYYAGLARQRVEAAGPNTIGVLIWAEPAALTVIVAAGARAADVFGAEDCEELAKLVREKCANKDYDEGLTAAATRIRDTLNSTMGGPLSPPPSFDWMEVFWLIVPLVGIWLVLEFLCVLHKPENTGPRQIGYGGAGSYFSGLFTTLTSRDLAYLFSRGPSAPMQGAETRVAGFKAVMPAAHEPEHILAAAEGEPNVPYHEEASLTGGETDLHSHDTP